MSLPTMLRSRRRLFAGAALALVLALAAGPAFAVPGDENWDDRFGLPGPDSPVDAIADWNGQLVVGGVFSHTEARPMRFVAAYDGAHWNALGAGLNGPVRSLAVVDGTLYAAGYFDSSGTTYTGGLARWNGSSWSSVGGWYTGGDVRLVADGHSLLVLGYFDEVGPASIYSPRVARWDGVTWHGMGSCPISQAATCAARVGGTLYVGGESSGSGFDSPLAAWDGSDWTSVQGIDEPGGPAAAITSLVGIGGTLYAAGNFLSLEGATVPAKFLGAWDGTAWSAPGAGQIDDATHVAGLLADGAGLLVAGDFYANAPGLARWDGASWSPGPPSQFVTQGFVYGLGRWQGHLVSYGGFARSFDETTFQAVGTSNVAWHDGSRWRPCGVGHGLGPGEFDMRVMDLWTYGGQLVATGSFYSSPDGTLSHVAAWDGSRWTGIGGLQETFGGYGNALTTWNNQLVVGGRFTSAGGVPCRNVATWNGTSWSALGGGMNGNSVEALATVGTTLVAAGMYGLGNDVTTNAPLGWLARWNGTSWVPMANVTARGTSMPTVCLAAWNGKLVYGGWFTAVDGVSASNIAAWDGSQWSALGDGLDWAPAAIGVHGGELYASGGFTHSGATALPRIARWTGSAWVPVGTGLDFIAYALASFEGKLFAAGSFSAAGGSPAAGIASWNGSTWSALGSGLGGGFAYANALQPFSNALWVGGPFSQAGGKLSFGVARWTSTPTAAVEPGPAASGLRGVTLSAAWPNPARGRASVAFRLAEGTSVDAAVYDASGRRVRTLARATFDAGAHTLTWDGRDASNLAASPGLYWVRVVTPGGSASTKVAVVR